jgi:hypothetical protein
MRDPARTARMGENGRARVRAFDWSGTAATILDRLVTDRGQR